MTWTLIHSLWQGAAAALGLYVALLFLRTASHRYIAACGALFGVVLAFVATLIRMRPTAPDFSAVRELTLPAVALGNSASLSRLHADADMLAWLVPFWIAGVVFFHARNITAWFAAQRLRHRGVCSAPAHWQARVESLRQSIQASVPVRLLESSVATVPAVIGWIRPVILTPVGMLTAMPLGQIEALLLHELAHVRRHDYLVNLIQTFVESFLFYHPAVWWISGVIRSERENCCDDLVVATRGGHFEYATALARLEQSRWPATALTATGGNLMHRITRLLNPTQTRRTPVPVILPVLGLAIITAFAVGAWQAPPVPPALVEISAPWSQWVNEVVAYIIRPEERAAFLRLQTDEERGAFVEQFWLLRDPTPETVTNEFKIEHFRRIAYVNNHYGQSIPGWKSDRGRIYITFGPADEIEAHPDGMGKVQPYEAWRYKHLEGIGNNVMIDFAQAANGDYVMTPDPNKSRAGVVDREKLLQQIEKEEAQAKAAGLTDKQRKLYMDRVKDLRDFEARQKMPTAP